MLCGRTLYLRVAELDGAGFESLLEGDDVVVVVTVGLCPEAAYHIVNIIYLNLGRIRSGIQNLRRLKGIENVVGKASNLALVLSVGVSIPLSSFELSLSDNMNNLPKIELLVLVPSLFLLRFLGWQKPSSFTRNVKRGYRFPGDSPDSQSFVFVQIRTPCWIQA